MFFAVGVAFLSAPLALALGTEPLGTSGTLVPMPAPLGEAAALSSRMARTSPTFTSDPSWCLMLARTPARSALTSRSIFSVSNSTSGSPALTLSPCFFSHLATRASTTDSPSSGTTILVGILIPDPRSLIPGPRSLTLGFEHLVDNGALGGSVPARRSFRGARVARPADVAQRPSPIDHLLDQRPREFPRAHVLRLLLHPAHLADAGVASHHLGDQIGRERVELFDADDRHVGIVLAPLARQQVDR